MSVYNQIVLKNTVEERYLEVYALNTTVLKHYTCIVVGLLGMVWLDSASSALIRQSKLNCDEWTTF